jgi:sugar-specific transcriptional regulator TrmB
MKVVELFKKLGFSEGEGKAYAAILSHPAPTLQVIHEYTGIERRNVYDIINKLISKGLVTYNTENKKKVYHVTHPNKIKAYLDDEGAKVDEAKKELADNFPNLTNIYGANKEEIHAEIYRGNEGIRAIFEDMLNCTDQYFIGGNFGMFVYLGEAFCRKWNVKREEKKIRWHDLVVAQPLVARKIAISFLESMKYRRFKVLPDQFNSPHVIFIYGNKVANVFWREQSFAFVIENEKIAKNYIEYFEYLWNSLPEYKK